MYQFFVTFTGKVFLHVFQLLKIFGLTLCGDDIYCNCFHMFPQNGKIWALQDGTTVVVGGKTNRAKGEFPDEMNSLLDRVPEIVESSSSKQSTQISG